MKNAHRRFVQPAGQRLIFGFYDRYIIYDQKIQKSSKCSSYYFSLTNQTGGYGTLLAGVDAKLSRTLRLGVGASTTIDQPGQRNSAINVTLGAPF